ncbi:MAG: DNA recombination protein RmuC [Candidatus Anoxychlamydiales bacterium]|nr:DNA recombination protein RmuC [Candidatus Anoxychlamydiales bacterium]NGX41546.1 DNA recombination protein RmuC [Candidatus Anoxychlamydiales bacterium]HEU64922.1 DNA recombination protein RmuC [Chlamydiota bacterium]
MNLIYLLIAISIFFMVSILAIIFSLKKTKKNMAQTFKSLSFDIMQQNSKSFMDLAKINFEKYHVGYQANIDHKQKELEKVLDPLKESINKIDEYTKNVEKQRQGAYEALNKQIEVLVQSERYLREETHNLSKALKSPNVRGSWGQIHLRRVVELAGLLNNCDFFEQQSTTKDDKTYRPDLIIRLPKDKQIIIDAKTPIDSYLDAQDKQEDHKLLKLKSHALNLKKHINDLASKEYFSKFENTLEYVILFLPAEALLSSALSIDPTLLEMAAKKNIIIATPTTLIAILKTIAHIWKESEMSKNAKEIVKTGKELYERLLTMTSHFTKTGENLSRSVSAYNQTIASLNSRVFPSVKKLKDMGISSKENELEEISNTCNINALEKIND